MSEEENSTPIDVAKKKAKHLHSILKIRIPDVSLAYCLNSYARIEGARDWNTLSAILKASATTGNPYQKLSVFINETLVPMMTQIGTTHGMEVVTSPGAYFMETAYGTDNFANSSPSNKIDVTFRPKDQINTDYTFLIKVASKGIDAWTNEITFNFPEDYSDIPISILAGKRVPLEITPSVLRSTYREEPGFSLILETVPVLESAEEDKAIWDSAERVEYVRKDIDAAIGKYAKLNIAFQSLSKNWTNRKLRSSFETALWEVFTGTPRYMSAPTEFHRASFGDITLTAFADESGPHISGPGGSLYLGVSSIIYCEADKKKQAGYYIAKYGNSGEAIIQLKGIDKEDILRITVEFGVPPGYELAEELGIPFEEVRDEYAAFFRSRAFPGLKEWVARNRSFAKRIRKGAVYIPDWYERATGQSPIPDSDKELIEEGRKIRHSRSSK